MAKRKKFKFKEVKETGKVPPKTKQVEPSARDTRLDELMPLVTDVISKLLSASGMRRYRTKFIDDIKKVMKED